MKVSIDSQDETGESSGVDAASLWLLLAIVFFGTFLLMFLFFNRFIDVNDEIDIDPVQNSVDTPSSIDSDLDVPDAIDLDGSESPGVVGDTPVP